MSIARDASVARPPSDGGRITARATIDMAPLTGVGSASMFTLKKVFVIGALLIAGSIGLACHRSSLSTESRNTDARDQDIATAFKNHTSNIEVEGDGIVIKVLSDDLQKPRHQRFLLRLASGETLLITHNIDLAPRVDGLMEGDRVAFKGEYEWNDKGGVVHWTHRDPGGRHVAGWLRHQDKVYQ